MEERSADRMLEILKENPSRLKLLKDDPQQEIQKLRDEAVKPAYYGDKWLYRIAVIVLSSLAIITAISAIILKGTIPEALVALGSTAVGALVGLFDPSPTSK